MSAKSDAFQFDKIKGSHQSSNFQVNFNDLLKILCCLKLSIQYKFWVIYTLEIVISVDT